MRHLDDSVVLSSSASVSSDASGFSFSGNIDVRFSRVAFVAVLASTTATSEAIPEAPVDASLVSVSDGAVVTIDSCSFHHRRGPLELDKEGNDEIHDEDRDGGSVVDRQLGTLMTWNHHQPSSTSRTNHAAAAVIGVSATCDGVVNVSNSLFFRLSNGAVVDDGGRISCESTTFSDTSVSGLAASNNARAAIEGCEFVNSELSVRNNCHVDVVKTTFKRQPHPAQRGDLLPTTATGDLVKIRRGSAADISDNAD